MARDTQIPTDPDYPAEADRDVYLINATYDADYLYLAWRRTAGGQKAITFGAYIDTSGDGLLQDDEPVVVYTVGTGNPYCAEGWILHYNQARDTVNGPKLYPAGDPMGRDGDTPDGWARWQDGYTAPTRALDAYLAPNGIECEARVAWADLGIPAGSPIAIHFASGNGEAWGNPGTPSITWKPIGGGKLIEENRGQVEDNVEEIWWLRETGVSVTPNNVRGAAENTTVSYDHTITNLGNRRGDIRSHVAVVARLAGRGPRRVGQPDFHGDHPRGVGHTREGARLGARGYERWCPRCHTPHSGCAVGLERDLGGYGHYDRWSRERHPDSVRLDRAGPDDRLHVHGEQQHYRLGHLRS